MVIGLRPGAITISATSEGKTGSATLVVTPGALTAARVVLRDSIVVMGKTTQATVLLTDSAGNAVSGVAIAYDVADTSIATVDGSGVVTGVYEGTTTLRVTAGAITTSATVRIALDPTLPAAFWKVVPNGFPSIAAYYRPLGEGIVTSLVTDMNRDGRQDVALHFWKFRSALERQTLPADAPVENRLAVFFAGADGVLRDSTVAAFGSGTVDLGGGVSRNVRAFDLNADGSPDWVYALNREDGRPCGATTTTCTNWMSQNVAIMSTGAGRYRTVPFGEANYHHTVAILPLGSQTDIVTSGTRAAADGRTRLTESYSYTGGYFTATSGYPLVGQTLFVPVIPRGASASTHFVFDGDPLTYPGPPRITVARPSGSGRWTATDSLFAGTAVTTVNWTAWNGESCVGCTFRFSEDGRDFVTMAYNDGCTYLPTPASRPRLLVMRQSYLLTSPANGRTSFQEGSGMVQEQRLLTYDIVNDKLVRVPAIADASIQANVADVRCGDVNGDGYDDVVAYALRSGARPVVFLNDRTGTLVRLNDQLLPEGPRADYEAQWAALFLDADGDGIQDLLYYARGSCTAASLCATPQLWRGRRNLQLP